MDMTAAETEAIRIARDLIKAGIPVFAAAPNPEKPGQYYLPKEWEKTVPSEVWLERWRPGWALGAVGGHVADFLDFDPRNGGTESRKELEIQGQMPRAFGVQTTPSGGEHHVISLTGERKATGFMPGLDLQSGEPTPDNQGKHGRGFIYIAPTVRPSKAPETLGQLRAYAWTQPPDLDYLSEFVGSDDTLEGIVARVHAKRSQSAGTRAPTQSADDATTQLFMQPSASWGSAREFSRAEAEAYCVPSLEALEKAQIGEIEEHANTAAAILSHFVPALWSADEAFAVLGVALSKTAYDPNRQDSSWTAEKFRAVLDGRRPPADNWKATARVTAADVAAVFGDDGSAPMGLPASAEQAADLVDAMLAKMLTPQQMTELPPPVPLIKGLLDLDSLAWMIGQPGSFKSFISLDMAAHVGTGMPWRGMEVTQGPVVYIAAEGTRGMGKRVRAWEKKYGHMGDVRFLPLPIKVKDVVAWRTLVEACRRIRPVMVVIDTQARVAAGIEENSNTEMSIAIEAFDAIKTATGGCVLVVHHTTKSGETTRGAGAQDGAQDTRIKLERANPRSSMAVKLIEDKQKDMAESAEGLKLRLVEQVISEPGEERLTSLRLGDVFEELAGTGEEPEVGDLEPWRGKEPADWTKNYVASNSKWQRRILQVLFDHAETAGLSEAKVKETVIARWSQKPEVDTWNDAWPKVVSAEIDGEPLCGTAGGRKYVSLHFRELIQLSGLS